MTGVCPPQAQYVFIHDALEELITCGDTAVSSSNLRVKMGKMHKIIPEKAISGFSDQFKVRAGGGGQAGGQAGRQRGRRAGGQARGQGGRGGRQGVRGVLFKSSVLLLCGQTVILFPGLTPNVHTLSLHLFCLLLPACPPSSSHSCWRRSVVKPTRQTAPMPSSSTTTRRTATLTGCHVSCSPCCMLEPIESTYSCVCTLPYMHILCMYSPTCTSTHCVCTYSDNMSRVRLRPTGVTGAEYINASFLDVSSLLAPHTAPCAILHWA